MTHLFDPPTANLPKPDAPEPGSQSVFRNSNFLFLWMGQVFSQIADKVYLVLIVAIITARFQNADEPISGWVSSVMVAFTIPAILFGSLAGAFVDRWSKKWVLVGSNLLRGALVAVIPVLLWATRDASTIAGSPVGFWGLLTITFLVSTLTQFFAPAEQSAIALVVDKPKLLAANSVYTATIMAALILGFALGEPLLSVSDRWFGPTGKEFLVGGSYLVAGLILLLLRTPEANGNAVQQDVHILEDLKQGFQYLSGQRTSLAALLQLVCTFSISAALTVLAVRLAEVMPEIKSDQFGFLLAAASVGMAIGAAIVGKFGNRCSRQLLALIGSMGMAVFLAGLSFVSDRLALGLVAIGGIGISAGLCAIPMQTAIQEETPEEMRGKVFGLQNNAVNIALSLPLALAGIAESYLGLKITILALCAIAAIGGIVTWQVARSS